MKSIVIHLFLVVASLCSCSSQNNSNAITVIDFETLQKKITENDLQLVDVRTPLEFNRGAIGGAINANILSNDFTSAISGLDKSKPVYVYCKKGGRSNLAANKLVDLGFTEIYDFQGGWNAWKAQLKKNK